MILVSYHENKMGRRGWGGGGEPHPRRTTSRSGAERRSFLPSFLEAWTTGGSLFASSCVVCRVSCLVSSQFGLFGRRGWRCARPPPGDPHTRTTGGACVCGRRRPKPSRLSITVLEDSWRQAGREAGREMAERGKTCPALLPSKITNFESIPRPYTPARQHQHTTATATTKQTKQTSHHYSPSVFCTIPYPIDHGDGHDASRRSRKPCPGSPGGRRGASPVPLPSPFLVVSPAPCAGDSAGRGSGGGSVVYYRQVPGQDDHV